MPDREVVLNAADPTLADAGRTAVQVCLAMTAADVVTVVTDEPGRPVAGAMLSAAEALGANARAFLLERFGPRPLARFPPEILAAFEASTATVLAVTPLAGELRARLQVLEMVSRRNLRHAHLIAVAPESFRMGMCADYHAIDALQDRLLVVLRQAAAVRVTAPNGTDLDATFSPAYRWVKSTGLIHPGRWQNLPSGQTYSVPETLDGVYVADRSLGDWFGTKYPHLPEYPLTCEFSGGRLRDVRSANAQLAREFALFVRSNENGDRVGEFGIGTNPWLRFLDQQPTHNENVPGIHLAVGDPFGAQTGATWTSKTRVSLIGSGMSLQADGRALMTDGVFAPDILAGLRVESPVE